MSTRAIYSVLGIGAVVVVLFVSTQGAAEPQQTTPTHATTTSYTLTAASSTVHVVGIVTPVAHAVIAAQTNGVLETMAVTEGHVVHQNTLLAVQATPVAAAQRAYQDALMHQKNAEQATVVDARTYTAEKAAVVAHSAETIAQLQDQARTTTVQAKTGVVRTALESGIATMLDTLTFVHHNPSLFSDTNRTQFQEIVTDLYGHLPTHFRTTISFGVDTTSSHTLDMIESLRAHDLDTLSVLDVETLSVVVMGQLRALIALYTTAEHDVLDRDVATAADTTYATYTTNRAAIIAALSTLEEGQAALLAAIAALDDTTARASESVQVTDLDAALAARQAAFSQRVADAAAHASAAATAVAAAEVGLGTVRAPFAGVVAEVYREVGEYVTAGTPLLSLQGSGARELVVSVPNTIGAQIQPGDAFMVADTVAGVVDRLSPVHTGHSMTVFIALFDTQTPVGTSMHGVLSFTTTEETWVVPRAYLFFATQGPVVRTRDGVEHVVTIAYDAGTAYMVQFRDGVPTDDLVPNRVSAL